MKNINFIAMVIMAFAITSCSQTAKQEQSVTTKNELFSKGIKMVNDDRFNGTVWVNALITADSANKTAVGNVVFEPGARSDWHIHPAGQILIATGGTGYYQEKDKPKKVLHRGDVIKCPPNVPHWHGAGPDEEFVQIAITGREKGPTQWLGKVTDEEYNK